MIGNERGSHFCKGKFFGFWVYIFARILSFIGTAEQWQAATASRPAKYTLVDHIRRLLDEHNADGVDLNCANGGPEGRDAFHFHEFLSDLRRMLGKTKQIMVKNK
jgi:hypothetical protein